MVSIMRQVAAALAISTPSTLSKILFLGLCPIGMKEEQISLEGFIDAMDNVQTFMIKLQSGPELGTHSEPLGKILWLCSCGGGSLFQEINLCIVLGDLVGVDLREVGFSFAVVAGALYL